MLNDLERVAALVSNDRFDDACEVIAHTPGLAKGRFPDGSTLLMRIAGVRGAAPVLELLIQQGAELDAQSRQGGTAIGATLESDRAGHETLAELRTLLQAGADPNVIVNGGNTALQYAIYLGKLEHVRLLLQFGADPARPSADVRPLTAYDVARAVGNKKVLDLLAGYEK
jgi:ankyrin repeat protein